MIVAGLIDGDKRRFWDGWAWAVHDVTKTGATAWLERMNAWDDVVYDMINAFRPRGLAALFPDGPTSEVLLRDTLILPSHFSSASQPCADFQAEYLSCRTNLRKFRLSNGEILLGLGSANASSNVIAQLSQ